MSVEQDLPRRSDRSKDERWIRSFLKQAPTGTLAVGIPATAPHLNTNLFVFDESTESIVLHSARTGALPWIVANGAPSGVPASFTAFEMGRLLPAEEALCFSVEYASVVVVGRLRSIEDPFVKERDLQMILDKYAPHLRPGRDYRPIAADELVRTAVYRLQVLGWSGKEKIADETFKGAYRYEDVCPVAWR